MASERKYSLEITVRSGDRVLTTLVYPDQDYVEVVTTQAIIAMALVKAGFDQAVVKGDEVPPDLAEIFGVGGKAPNAATK